ncbi:putative MFS multidrug transporter [Microthyrium microscopicum]|uniref:Putative MFS multidrug transporter n=1 Tax=Microthyrium microscopicum TaxID=703497 RepID=A0A6A6TZY1_9PEZI|nr:putative MFS multidrug transporter [Microthyrium microscopicum]
MSSPTYLLDKETEKDIEKDGAFTTSSTASVHSLAKDEVKIEVSDPNIVDWDGPDDPQNPLNWPNSRRWGSVAVVSGITFLTPLGSAIFAPGVDLVMDEFHSHSDLLSGFVVSVYVLGFAFGPLTIAPMSEMYGRLPLYHICMTLFVICNIACALSTSLNMLIVFRFLAGTFGAAPLTLGGGTIADVMPASQRAKAMSVWVLGPTFGPVLGPICGGFISQNIGWRWNFWILSIAAGVGTLLGFLLMKETYAPTLLDRKTKRLRKETGNMNLRSKLDMGLTPRDLFWFSIVRPTKLLLFSPIVLFLSIYVAITYAYLYLFFTTISDVFANQYHFKKELVGLSFLGLGVGQFAGQFVYSYFATKSYNSHVKKGGFKPEHRLETMIFGAIIIPIALFWYGWAVQAKTQWMNPEVATFFFSLGMLFIWMPANVYLIDVYTVYAASAMAANTVLRSLAAAILPLAGPKMYAKLGYGWGNSLLGFIALFLLPIPLIFMKYGERMRTQSTLKL